MSIQNSQNIRSYTGTTTTDDYLMKKVEGGGWEHSDTPRDVNCTDSEHCKAEMTNEFVVATKRYILTELGYPNVEVELCDEHLDNAIRNAISDFARWNVMGTMKYWRFAPMRDVAEYPLPEDLKVVRDVTVMRLADWDGIFDSDVLVNPLYLKNSKEAYQDILTFWLSEAAFETWKRTYGLDVSWDIIGANEYIRIYPTPRNDRSVIIKGSCHVCLENITERHLGTKDRLFRDLSLSYAKRTLGRIRGKYPAGINTSQGTVQLDGDTLLGEAREEIQTAQDELKKSGKPLGFYVG